jgi:peptidoglycan hydrolase-like amidase
VRKLLAAILTAAALFATTGEAVPKPAAALPADLTIVGHGWGHGRGMGQYGALGYALAPWDWGYQQILAHFYGGTILASTVDTTVEVRLNELDGSNQITVAAPAGAFLVVNGAAQGANPDTLKAAAQDQTVTASNGGDLTVTGPWSTGSARAFVGSIVIKGTSTGYAGQVWNAVALEQYVEGVVPRESPASWPQAALQAQAVAARSYALAALAASGPTICDTGSCQVYGGDPSQYPNSDSSNSDAAVTATTGQILECGADAACGSPTQVALTEYSSSTGGYTAGGRFPAVVDDGDATPSNPNHDWSVTVPTSKVEAAFPGVGSLQSIIITSRNGLGDLGGRVDQMILEGISGTLTISGAQFAGALGLDSNWFAITDTAPPPGSDTGYWIVASNGAVYSFGTAPNYGSMVGHALWALVLGMAPTGDGDGYWLVAGDGGVFSFGDASFYGSTGGWRLDAPVIGMTSTADGRGYWLVASDGGIFSFGDASFYGSTGGNTPSPIVAMNRTSDGNGYWLVTATGQIYTFGDARFYGDTRNVKLWQPVVGIVPTADGRGYWLVARDGGIFTFGDAGFVGSLGGSGASSIVSVAPTPNNGGYLILSSAGHVYPFGNATYSGDPSTEVPGWAGGALGIFARA